MRTADERRRATGNASTPGGDIPAFARVVREIHPVQALLGIETIAPLMRIRDMWAAWACEHPEDEHAQATGVVDAGLDVSGYLCDVLLDIPHSLWRDVSRAIGRNVLHDLVEIEKLVEDNSERDAYSYYLLRVEEAVRHLQGVAADLRASATVRKPLLYALEQLRDALDEAYDVLSPEEAMKCEPL
jgi:hypothetical protein